MRLLHHSKAMSEPAEPKDPLAEYVRHSKKSDAAIGRLVGVSRWTISRGRRGDPPLTVKVQVALEKFTGVTPAEWGEYYFKVLNQPVEAKKKAESVDALAQSKAESEAV